MTKLVTRHSSLGIGAGPGGGEGGEAAASTAPSPKAKAAGDAIDCRAPPARLPLAYVGTRFSVRRSRFLRRLV